MKEDLRDAKTREHLKCLNSVPMKLSLEYREPVVSDTADLVAGIMGFTVVEPENTFNHVPSIQPGHMWAMLLSKDSPLLEPYTGNGV